MAPSVPGDRQGFQRAKLDARLILEGVGGEPERGEPLRQRPKHLLALDPGQRRAEAVVDPRPEGEMGVGLSGNIEPIGVGEVFIVAGQSYAGGHNDEVLKVADPSQAVSTYDWQTKTWRVAHDPPPHNGDGGSIWPPLGDMLVPTLRVPVSFVNVSVGGTSTTKWHPDGPLQQRAIKP